MNAVLDTAQSAIAREPSLDTVQLNPNYLYLRVTIDGRVALLVLGYLDPSPKGPIEVWYSADREVLRLQNGRLVGAVGVTTEWRNVSLPDLASWSAVAHSKTAVQWIRIRDVMPGYRFGVRDFLRLRVIPPPEKVELKGIDPKELTWFEEETESGPNVLPAARYGVVLQRATDTVIYGEQCLAPEFCFAWQRWPVSRVTAERK